MEFCLNIRNIVPQSKERHTRESLVIFTALLQRLENTLMISEKCCFLKNNQSLGKQQAVNLRNYLFLSIMSEK